VLFVDQDAGDARQLGGQRAQVSAGLAVEHLDPIGAGVCDVHPSSRPEGVGVIEAWLCARRDWNEAGPNEAHPIAPDATSFLHHA
jgi:hypothetical protein